MSESSTCRTGLNKSALAFTARQFLDAMAILQAVTNQKVEQFHYLMHNVLCKRL